MKSRKYTICFVLDNTSFRIAGGGAKSPLTIARNLSKRYRIIFISSKTSIEKKSKEIKENITIYRFPSLSVPKSNRQSFMTMPSLRSVEKVLREEKVDLIHIHSPFYVCLITLKAAKKFNIPVIITNHSQAENLTYNLPVLNIGFINFILYKYFIYLYNKADAVVSVSHFGERLIKKYGLRTKSLVISNGVNLNKFRAREKHTAFKKVNISFTKDKIILFIGRLHDDKNPTILIKAFEVVLKKINATLIIIGAGYLRDSLKKLSKELGISKKVVFLQDIPESILPFYYNISDLFVLPSNAELQGMVILEAMASGKPVIVSDSKYNASQELVDGNGFIFKANDPIDLSKKIVGILGNNKLSRRMGKKSLKLIKKHDFKNTIKNYSDLYQKFIKNVHK